MASPRRSWSVGASSSRQMRPIESDAALFAMFARAGLVAPRPIFVSLQFKVFLARFEPGAAG